MLAYVDCVAYSVCCFALLRVYETKLWWVRITYTKRDHSDVLQSRFDRANMIFYYHSIVTMAYHASFPTRVGKYDIFENIEISKKSKISRCKLYNNGCNTLMQYLMTISYQSFVPYVKTSFLGELCYVTSALWHEPSRPSVSVVCDVVPPYPEG